MSDEKSLVSKFRGARINRHVGGATCSHDSRTSTFEGIKCLDCGKIIKLAEPKRDTFDPVNNPKHYTEGREIEPIDVMHDWNLNASEAAALKYLARHRKKNGKEDLEKAIWYINDIIKREYSDE